MTIQTRLRFKWVDCEVINSTNPSSLLWTKPLGTRYFNIVPLQLCINVIMQKRMLPPILNNCIFTIFMST